MSHICVNVCVHSSTMAHVYPEPMVQCSGGDLLGGVCTEFAPPAASARAVDARWIKTLPTKYPARNSPIANHVANCRTVGWGVGTVGPLLKSSLNTFTTVHYVAPPSACSLASMTVSPEPKRTLNNDVWDKHFFLELRLL